MRNYFLSRVAFKYIFILLVFIVVVFLFASIFRGSVIDLFIAHKKEFGETDLIVVLEGGSIRFAPTNERVNKVISVYKENPKKILICSVSNYKEDIVDFLISNGIKNDDILISNYDYTEDGGTYNNAKEIISILKNNISYRNIEIITSPYHEFRVNLILSTLIKEVDFKQSIYFKFSHINNSEVSGTDNIRFIKIISHEILGSIVFKLQYIKSIYFDI